MKSANNELTTARNTPNPIVAAGKDDAPVPGKSSIAPTSSQGLAINLCRDSHHAMMAPIGARTNSIVMLTARFPKRYVRPAGAGFAARNPPWRPARCNQRPRDRLQAIPCPGGVSGVCHASVLALQGLLPAGLPLDRLQIRLNRTTIWAKPTTNAAVVMKPFSVVADGGTKAISPTSKYRRGTPSRPR